MILPVAEFAYNSSVDRTIGVSPFEVVTGFNPRQPIDLVPMAHHHSRIQILHRHLHLIYMHYMRKSDKRMKNNADYKASADFHRRLRTFNVGDM